MNVIISTNAGIILIRTLETNISEMLSEIHIFIQENVVEFVVWKMTVILSQPRCVKSLDKSNEMMYYGDSLAAFLLNNFL